MTWRFAAFVPALCLVLAGLSTAQTPRLVSPEVLPDRRVIVRVYAPQAREVRIVFERGGNSLSKHEDGVWEATIGPLDPGSYRYGFAVDGASVTDPNNVETERMQVMTRSILHVPGAAFMDTENVPHGVISVVTYYSTVLKTFRRFHIYTPPGYEANQRKYPVLYLLHGANESDQSWSTVGRAGFILDNLIADRAAVPMIVVMPNGHVDQTPPNVAWGAPTSSPLQLKSELVDFPKEFATEIIPYVDSHYRTITDRPHRAIAGLSMGGTQALNLAFADLERFSAVGIFSSGILVGSVLDWEQDHLAVLDRPALKNDLKMVWFKTGSEDPFIGTTKATVEMLKRHGFSVAFDESTGGHSWVNWRNYLHEFAAQLFR
jgi:enterochelin esterase-like enzyme